MHILLMAQCFAPEDVSAGKLITELAQGLLGYGNRLTVVTGAPNYPYGRVFPGYRNSLLSSEWRDGVRVIRTWSYISPRQTFWARLFHYGSYSATAFYGALFGARPDLIMNLIILKGDQDLRRCRHPRRERDDARCPSHVIAACPGS